MDFRQARDQLSLGLRRLAMQVGWMGLVAGGLVLLAAMELFTVTLPGAAEIADLEAQIMRQQESSRSGREIARGQDSDVGSQIGAFQRFFPPAAQMNKVLGELHDAAKQERLVLERGDYRLTEEAGLDLLRYQITLPVKGSYASIRGFLRRVLRDIPSISLDGIAIQRQSVGDEAVEVQIRFSLYHRGEQ